MTKRAVVVGTLVKWNAERGFGFVRRAQGADVFVSAKDARYSGINEDDLKVGVRLSLCPGPTTGPAVRTAPSIFACCRRCRRDQIARPA
jgi:cold shock CspA family protein